MPLRDILLTALVPVLWGLGVTFTKAALTEFPPILLMALRFSLTALVFVWFFRPPWGLMRKIFWITLVSATIQYSLTFTGLDGLDASTAVLVIQLEVPMGALLAAIVFRDYLGWRRAFGMTLSFGGVALIAGEPTVRENLLPLFLVLGGVFTWAVGQIMVKQLGGKVGGFTLIAWVAVFATPQLFIASAIFEDNHVEAIRSAGWLGWSVVIYLGLIMNGVGYAIWYHMLGKHRVSQVMPFLLLLPVVSVIASVVLLGERITPLVGLGGGVVLIGVTIIVFDRRKAPSKTETPDKAAN